MVCSQRGQLGNYKAPVRHMQGEGPRTCQMYSGMSVKNIVPQCLKAQEVGRAWLQFSVWQVRDCGSCASGSKSNVASPEDRRKLESCWRWVAASVCKYNAHLFHRFLFSEAAGSPHWNGVALQDMKLRAGGRFLGTGGRKI